MKREINMVPSEIAKPAISQLLTFIFIIYKVDSMVNGTDTKPKKQTLVFKLLNQLQYLYRTLRDGVNI